MNKQEQEGFRRGEFVFESREDKDWQSQELKANFTRHPEVAAATREYFMVYDHAEGQMLVPPHIPELAAAGFTPERLVSSPPYFLDGIVEEDVALFEHMKRLGLAFWHAGQQGSQSWKTQFYMRLKQPSSPGLQMRLVTRPLRFDKNGRAWATLAVASFHHVNSWEFPQMRDQDSAELRLFLPDGTGWEQTQKKKFWMLMLLRQGGSVGSVAETLEVSRKTVYRWREELGPSLRDIFLAGHDLRANFYRHWRAYLQASGRAREMALPN